MLCVAPLAPVTEVSVNAAEYVMLVARLPFAFGVNAEGGE
jgi:hypothetical protein